VYLPGKPQRGDINTARGNAPGKPQRGDINTARGNAPGKQRPWIISYFGLSKSPFQAKVSLRETFA